MSWKVSQISDHAQSPNLCYSSYCHPSKPNQCDHWDANPPSSPCIPYVASDSKKRSGNPPWYLKAIDTMRCEETHYHMHVWCPSHPSPFLIKILIRGKHWIHSLRYWLPSNASLPHNPAHTLRQIALPSAHGLLIANQQWARRVHHTIDPSSFSAHSTSSSNSGKSSTTQHSPSHHTSRWALHLASATSAIRLWPRKWHDD